MGFFPTCKPWRIAASGHRSIFSMVHWFIREMYARDTCLQHIAQPICIIISPAGGLLHPKFPSLQSQTCSLAPILPQLHISTASVISLQKRLHRAKRGILLFYRPFLSYLLSTLLLSHIHAECGHLLPPPPRTALIWTPTQPQSQSSHTPTHTNT